ncbi:MAG: uroporphyrinogen-III C-methyltransferase [Dehalococcoidia bacterium]
MSQGKVYLVGAGPGDPGLITVKGMECLRQAEVVVYDRLIDDSLLDLVPPEAEMIYVGKSARVHAREQSEINRILIDKAGEGRTVVRLKGGDPFVLGRGGEECEALAASGIPYEVVPGISSAIASPAYAGIPVTHRQAASSFAVITGHEDPTKELSSINWDKLATGVDTLVFLMGMGNLPLIAEKLIECGRAPDTPVALIRQGTTLQQEVITATLSTVAEKAREAGFEPPVAIVVGEVVNLREKLQWFENRPLFDKRVLVTRARTQVSSLSKLLAERGAQPIELPAIEIQDLPDTAELDQAIRDIPRFDWVFFTSANGVEAVWNRLVALGRDARQFGAVKIGVIGPATALALAERGLYPDFMPAEYTSDGILAGLAERDIKGCRILLPRADIAPADLVEGLAGLGAEPVEVTAYLTRPPLEIAEKARQMLLDGKIDIITFASSSTVTNLLEALGSDLQPLQNAQIACIGPVTAATAEAAGLKVDITAEEQTIPGLVRAIEEAYSNG